MRQQLTQSWTVVLSRPPTLWLAGVHGWLDAALDPDRRDPILDLLTAACDRDIVRTSRLEHAASRWAGAFREGEVWAAAARVLTALRNRLDAALGLPCLPPQEGPTS